MKQLRAIGVGSVFRTFLVLGAVAGILIGLILMIVDFVDHRFAEGAFTLILAPILYGVLGAAVNALMAWIYNRVADRFGGIEVDLGE